MLRIQRNVLDVLMNFIVGVKNMLLFKPEFVELILSGQKTQTRRFHKYPRKVGSIHECKVNYDSLPFCRVLILRVFQQMLCDISEMDVKREGFGSRQEFFDFFKFLGGNTSFVVTVYEFKVIQTF